MTIVRAVVAGAFVFAVWSLVVLVGAVLVAIDVATLRLPDAIILPLGAAVVGLLGCAAVSGGGSGALWRALAAGALVGGGYTALALLPRAGLGFGDVKLAAVLGCALGWFGWRSALLGAVLPYVLAGPVALVLLATGRARPDSPLPFGPWLLAGALLALLL